MKYKLVFEAPYDFEPGCCANCPLSLIDWSNDDDLFCVLNCRYDECPLKKADQSIDEENLKHSDSCKVTQE